MLAIDCLVGGLLVCSVVVNILALGAFWVTPSLRTTANRFVINLLIVNLVCCIILGPSLLLNAFTAHPGKVTPDVVGPPATIVLDGADLGPANQSSESGARTVRCLNGTGGDCDPTVPLIRSGEPPPSQDDVKFVKSRPGLGGESAAQLTLTKIRCWGLDLVVALGTLSVLLVVGDTWCAITDPLRYHSRISELKSWAFILGTWVLGVAFGIASGFRGDQKTVTLFKNRLTAEEVAAIESSHLSRNLTAGPPGMMDHLNISEDLYNTIFSYAYFVIVILLPFGLVCGMYWRIFSEARESGQRMRQNGSSPLLQSALNLAAASAQKQAAAAEKQQMLDQQRPDRGETDGLTLKIDKQIHYEDETITISSIQPVPQYTPPVGTGSFRHPRDSCLKPLLQQSPAPTPTHKLSQEPSEPSGVDRAQVVQIATPTGIRSAVPKSPLRPDTVLEIPPTPARTPPPLPLAAVHNGGKMRRNQSAGRLVSFREDQPELRPASLRQVHSTPNFQQCGAADFEHIGQHHILSLPAVHVPPKALSYMTSIRHRLSNASSLFKYREESRAARISILVIIMFLVSYLPYGILVLMQGHVDLVIVSDQALLAIFTVVIANLSSPFIFAYRNKRVRRGVKRLLGVDKKTNERLQKLTNSNTHFNNNNNNNSNNNNNNNGGNGTGPVTGSNNTTNGNYSANISLASASCGEGLGGPPSVGGHKSHKVRIAAGLTRSGSSCKYLTPNHAAAVAVANGYIVEFERYPSDELNSLCIQKKSILKRVCDSSRKWGCNFATNSCTSNDEQTEV